LPRKRKLKIGLDEDGYNVPHPRDRVGSGSFSGGFDATGRFVLLDLLSFLDHLG
jgi:hypothetical protein